MIKFKKLTIRNFLSFGNNVTEIDLTQNNLTLIKGLNLDKGTEEDNRSGTGKSSIFQALHYALFGKSINNEIKLMNIVNKTNKKNLEVSLTFEKDGTEYCIQRGRKPEYLRFLINNVDSSIDEAQGENSQTQEYIQKILDLEPDIFNQTILLTKNVETFLKQPLTVQRDIIEQLIGTTILTEKANNLKLKLKEYKQIQSDENARNQAILLSNEKLRAQHDATVLNIKSQVERWESSHSNNVNMLKDKLLVLQKIDFDTEIANHAFNEEQLHNEQLNKENQETLLKLQNEKSLCEKQILQHQNELSVLKNIDLEQEKNKFKQIDVYNTAIEKLKQINQENVNIQANINALTTSVQTKLLTIESCSKRKQTFELQKSNIKQNICPTCLRPLENQDNQQLLDSVNKDIEQIDKEIYELTEQVKINENEINQLKAKLVVVPDVNSIKKPEQPYYSTIDELYQHALKVSELEKNIELNKNKIIALDTQIQAVNIVPVLPKKPTIYGTTNEVNNAKQLLFTTEEQMKHLLNEQNPYVSTLEQLKEPEYMVFDNSKLLETEKFIKHTELLVKLLTDKDSFVRKKVVERNLTFLNQSIKKYLLKIGSIHEVNFMPDMSVDITKQGESFDFANLSEGEKTSITLSLNFAFRELFERLHDNINILCFDEREGGLDKRMVRNFIDMLQEKSDKNIFVVSHREEFIRTIPYQITCQMLRNFTTIKNENVLN